MGKSGLGPLKRSETSTVSSAAETLSQLKLKMRIGPINWTKNILGLVKSDFLEL